jgi:hypothetical protein
MKPAPIPNIDLGGTVRIIETKNGKHVWNVLAKLKVASRVKAKEVARKHGLRVVWLFDDLGNRELLTVNG